MPMKGIVQPDFIYIDKALRLRKYDGAHDFAFDWYQDPDTLWVVDANRTPYTRERLNRMYTYLNEHGELYFIEIQQNGKFFSIGDVTFWEDDMPIVIGPPEFRGKGIGRRVVTALINRARELGFMEFRVGEIYRWNTPSSRLFTSMGFEPYEETEQGHRYKLTLTEVQRHAEKIR